MSTAIHDDDQIARCVIFPRHFQGSIHTDAALISFGSAREDGASHESGVLCKILASDDEVHEVGCRIAAKQNERSGAAVGSPKRRYYCGFRKARAGDVAVSGEGYRVILTLDGEDGEAAHVDIALFVEAHSKSERATIKVEVGMVLSEKFGPVFPHTCAGDEGDCHHPLIVDPNCLTKGLPDRRPLQATLPFAPEQ